MKRENEWNNKKDESNEDYRDDENYKSNENGKEQEKIIRVMFKFKRFLI